MTPGNAAQSPITSLPEPSKTLEAALRYAEERSWFVFPLWPVLFDADGKPRCGCWEGYSCQKVGKHPQLKWGRQATTSRDQIVTWWSNTPESGIGIATGPSGLVVFDVDDNSDFARFCEEYGYPNPSTPVVNTGFRAEGKRGYQLYFKHSLGDIFPASLTGLGFSGIDIKASGGFVVAPPSLHKTGVAYEFAGYSEQWLPTSMRAAWRHAAATRVISSSLTLAGNHAHSSGHGSALIPNGIRPPTIRDKRRATFQVLEPSELPDPRVLPDFYDSSVVETCSASWLRYYEDKPFAGDYKLARKMAIGGWDFGFSAAETCELVGLAYEAASLEGRRQFKEPGVTVNSLVNLVRSLYSGFERHGNVPFGRYRLKVISGKRDVFLDRAEVQYLETLPLPRRSLLYALLKCSRIREDRRAELPRLTLARYVASCTGKVVNEPNVKRLIREYEGKGILRNRKQAQYDPDARTSRATSFEIHLPCKVTGQMVDAEEAAMELGLQMLTREFMRNTA